MKYRTYISIYYDLPFLINVGDGFRDKELEQWYQDYIDKKEELPYSKYAPRPDENGLAIIGSNTPVYLPNELTPTFVVRIRGKYLIGIQFLYRVNQLSTFKVIGEVMEDKYGNYSYSSCRINFDLVGFPKEMHNDDDLFLELSIEAINKFIDYYRIINNKFYITAINKKSIKNIHYFFNYSDNTKDTKTYAYSTGPIHALNKTRVSGDTEKKLREDLLSDNNEVFIRSFYLNALDKADSGHWREAIIELELFYEIWIKKFIRTHLEKCGKMENEISSYFISKGKYNQPKSVYNLTLNGLKDTIGLDLSEYEEFANWCRFAKDIRNEIMHGSRLKITEEEYRSAISSIQKLIDLINENYLRLTSGHCP